MYNKVLIILTVLFSVNSKAQLLSFSEVKESLKDSNYFLDASLFGKKVNNYGKLIGFPRTDLTNFTFDLSLVERSIVNGYYFDGVLAFNSVIGTTLTGQGEQVKVTPGFYYFSNPKGGKKEDGGDGIFNINAGRWRKLGGQEIVNHSEMETNLSIDGNPIYSFKGSFTADGSTTQITLSDLPADTASAITSLYRVTIYNKDKKMFTNTVYSFDATNRKIITGAPNVSVVYEAGNYNYILEYLK
ncbi:hypothetical protein O2K51_08880 [Apibacter raozihei]|uniref:hypothetical protein n=1 Tax=Apibacter raozihei TaxID=2500547 RepID=UPI000FE2F7EE|nr:hypothetical protein [Apibacter raozihei]